MAVAGVPLARGTTGHDEVIRDGLVVQWPDTHIPDHHTGAVRSITKFIGDTDPELVVFTGDLFDVLSAAKWTSGTVEENGKLLQKELDVGKRVLGNLREVYSGRIAWIPGNHEERLWKWGVTRGRGVFGVDCLTIPHMADFDGFGIECPAGETRASGPWQFAPGVNAIHGTTVRKYAGYTVHAEMDKFGSSIIMGHTHRLALVMRNSGRANWFGIEGGHLMDQKKADYLTYGVADWRMGFSVIEVRGGVSHPRIVQMNAKGQFWMDAVRYE